MPRATAATPAMTTSQAPRTQAWPSGVAMRTRTSAPKPAAARRAPCGRCCCCIGLNLPRRRMVQSTYCGDMEESGSIYAEGRARLTDLVAEADPDGRTRPVPGCPRWAVKDVIAHVTGVCADVV